jgi:NodT family efflux transporter outer membrane factor (OMF) lipoprotein
MRSWKAPRLRAGLMALLLGGCTVGPNYHRPPAIMSASYKELAGWKVATPSDTIDRGAWWSIYDDPILDGLERQVAVSNQTLKAQEAAFRQSVDAVALTRSQLFPTIGVSTSVQRGNISSGTSGTTGLTTGTASGTTTSTGLGSSGTGSGGTRTISRVSGTVDWELDLWGRIRRQVESSVASSQASAADLASVLLSLQAQLAIDYFLLRAADSLTALLEATVRDFQQALDITQNQAKVGVALPSDLVTAQTQVETARAALINAGVQRATLEHAIAVLIGRAPAELTIAPAPLATRIPVVPPGVPSELLERRPDIAAAERMMQAQNAQIGVAVAAFYPTITLSALIGAFASPVSGASAASSLIWALGAAASEPLFEGGARRATEAATRAAYDQAVAVYRQTVLTAFQGVEDQLSTLRILAEETGAAEKAVTLARRNVQIALNEYQAGTQPYTTVAFAQNTLLLNEETALAVQQNRFLASATLIENLGGGWQAEELPSPASLQRFNPLLPGSRLP